MAYSRLLLLLLAVISSHLPEVHARPTDFWCNCQARKNMENSIEGLKDNRTDCVGSHTLPSPVQLPCVYIRTAEWANKTLQQKHAEVVVALKVFQVGVKRVRNQITLQCQAPLLTELGQHITNYLAIINRLQIQNDTATPFQSTVQICSSQTSLTKVLEQYRNLLRGKLEHLAFDLKDSMCIVEPRRANK